MPGLISVCVTYLGNDGGLPSPRQCSLHARRANFSRALAPDALRGAAFGFVALGRAGLSLTALAFVALGRAASRRALITPLALAFAALTVAPPPPSAAAGWTILAQPTTQSLRKMAFLSNTQGWVVGEGGTILLTTDGGLQWTPQASPVPYNIVDIEMLNANRGWALAQQFPVEPDFEYSTSVLHTTNGGTLWSVQSTFPSLFLHAIAFVDSTQGCLGGEQGKLWWTNDGGALWNQAVVDSALFAQWPIHDFNFRTSTHGIATGGLFDVTGLVWNTTDTGHNWTHQRVAGEPIFASHFFNATQAVCVGGDLDYGAGMVHTTNGGAGWLYTYLGIWGQASALSFRTSTEGWSPLGFAGTVMKTTNSGRDWLAGPLPGNNAMYDVQFTDSSTGYMVGYGGLILRYDPNATGVDRAGAGETEAGPLLQVLPNPIRSRGRIAFRVPSSSHVSVAVYDVRGREVTRLVDEIMAPGLFAREFDGENLPTGVYLCRIAVGERTESAKILVVK